MNKIMKISLIFYFILNLFLITECQCETVLVPDIGTITGTTGKTTWTNKTIYEFLAIPYAKSPSGDLRFKFPVSAVTSEQNEIRADKHGISCPVYPELINLPEEDDKDLEDCLHLNIYTKNTTLKVPVMFYIHGGGLEMGSSQMHSGEFFLEKDVVFVAIQYRLGPLGFMTTKTEEMPENLGLRDCIMALNWVKSYIQYFGGDPDQITIFGESAGALLVSALIISPEASENLFQRAIMQSGTYFSPWGFSDDPIDFPQKVVKFTKCQQKDTLEEINRCFKTLPLMELMKAFQDHLDDKALNDISPYPSARLVESSILPISPLGYLTNFEPMKNITVMAGVTKHDGVFFVDNLLRKLNRTDKLDDPTYIAYHFLDRFLEGLGIFDYTSSIKGYLQTILFNQEMMMNGNLTELVPGLKDLANAITMKAPTLKAIQMQAKTYPEKTYMYTFDYKGNFSNMGPSLHPLLSDGVHHADDLLYLFPFISLNEKDTEIAKQMVEIWTSFAITGVPKAEGLPEWSPVNRYSGPYMHIDEVSYLGEDFLDEYTVVTDEHRSGGITLKTFDLLIFVSILLLVLFQ